MSQRYATATWIGIKDHKRDLLGLVVRSGYVLECGHFCYVKVSVNGKRDRMASGAEDRIWPFHSVTLEEGEKPPPLIATWLGWGNDGNLGAYVVTHVGKLARYLVSLEGTFYRRDHMYSRTQNLNSNCFKQYPRHLWTPEWLQSERYIQNWEDVGFAERCHLLNALKAKR